MRHAEDGLRASRLRFRADYGGATARALHCLLLTVTNIMGMKMMDIYDEIGE